MPCFLPSCTSKIVMALACEHLMPLCLGNWAFQETGRSMKAHAHPALCRCRHRQRQDGMPQPSLPRSYPTDHGRAFHHVAELGAGLRAGQQRCPQLSRSSSSGGSLQRMQSGSTPSTGRGSCPAAAGRDGSSSGSGRPVAAVLLSGGSRLQGHDQPADCSSGISRRQSGRRR